jgi:arylsulfatase
MIVRWPGVVEPGAITSAQGHVVDFMPTLLELAGGKYPERAHGHRVPPPEGQSLIPSWRGQLIAPRDAPLYWELYGNRAVRDGKWKLVWGASEQRWELYDLSSDRAETNDLSGKYPHRVATMAADWVAWRKRTDVQSVSGEAVK